MRKTFPRQMNANQVANQPVLRPELAMVSRIVQAERRTHAVRTVRQMAEPTSVVLDAGQRAQALRTAILLANTRGVPKHHAA